MCAVHCEFELGVSTAAEVRGQFDLDDEVSGYGIVGFPTRSCEVLTISIRGSCFGLTP